MELWGKISFWFGNEYPKNLIVRKPVAGGVIVGVVCFVFILMYRPLDSHASGYLSYEATMALYCLVAAFAVWASGSIIGKINYFSTKKKWSIANEFLSIVLVLLGLGVAIYIFGFVMEPPSMRLNLATFLDSLFKAFLIGILPLLFFTAINYRYWLVMVNEQYKTDNIGEADVSQEEFITINSQLKKEDFGFYPSQFLFAESDGNYVVFNIIDSNNKVKKVAIRNSINSIEEQLLQVPFLFRTHRAFIVNLKKITAKKGNSLGYQIKLSKTNAEIPVSRNKTNAFNNAHSRFV